MKKSIFIQIAWAILSIILLLYIKKIKGKLKAAEQNSKKCYDNNVVLSDWLEVKNKNCKFDEWLVHFGVKNVAIYGFGVLGKAMYNELKDSKVNIICIADRNSNNLVSEVRCVSPTEIPKVDAIIVTVIGAYDEIESQLMGLYNTRILSIEDVLYGIGELR